MKCVGIGFGEKFRDFGDREIGKMSEKWAKFVKSRQNMGSVDTFLTPAESKKCPKADILTRFRTQKVAAGPLFGSNGGGQISLWKKSRHFLRGGR